MGGGPRVGQPRRAAGRRRPRRRTRARAITLAADVERRVGEAVADRKLLDELAEIRGTMMDDWTGTLADAGYTVAFRARGFDPFGRPPEEVGRSVASRPPRVSETLATYLDEWAIVRWVNRNDRAGAARLVAVARTAVPDPWRDRLRAAVAELDREPRLLALRELAKSAPPDLPPASFYLLGFVLLADLDAREAVAVLEAGQLRNPGDDWINFKLGAALTRAGRREEAIRYFEAARALRPETAHESGARARGHRRVRQGDRRLP